MSTDVSDVNDLFLTLVEDYRLNLIYQTSGSTVLNQYLSGWMRYSIQEFAPICTQTLTYNETTQQFTEDLTEENIDMLAQIMTKYWWNKTTQNVLQAENILQDHDLKTFSQASNLQAKMQYQTLKKEEISQLLQDYGFRHNKWDNWFVQCFSGD